MGPVLVPFKVNTLNLVVFCRVDPRGVWGFRGCFVSEFQDPGACQRGGVSKFLTTLKKHKNTKTRRASRSLHRPPGASLQRSPEASKTLQRPPSSMGLLDACRGVQGPAGPSTANEGNHAKALVQVQTTHAPRYSFLLIIIMVYTAKQLSGTLFSHSIN